MSNFIAGQYTATYTIPGGSAVTIGQSAQGFSIEHTAALRPVLGDKYAETAQDAIFRGMNMFCQFTLIEYLLAQVQKIMWPYGTWTGSAYSVAFLTQGPVGQLASALAGSLILTSVANTPAAINASPATQTHSLAILAEGFPVGLLFAPDLREIPLRMRLFPTSGVFGSQT